MENRYTSFPRIITENMASTGKSGGGEGGAGDENSVKIDALSAGQLQALRRDLKARVDVLNRGLPAMKMLQARLGQSMTAVQVGKRDQGEGDEAGDGGFRAAEVEAWLMMLSRFKNSERLSRQGIGPTSDEPGLRFLANRLISVPFASFFNPAPT